MIGTHPLDTVYLGQGIAQGPVSLVARTNSKAAAVLAFARVGISGTAMASAGGGKAVPTLKRPQNGSSLA